MRGRPIQGLAVATVALALALPAAQARAGGLDSALDHVTSEAGGPPGIAVAVHRPHRRSAFLRSGVANVKTGARPTQNLRMRIASMAKAFNGAVALALVERGELSLDDTIDEVLPGLWPLAGNVTLRQMLQHTARLPDYIKDPDFLDALEADPAQYMTPQQLIAYVTDQPPTPGTAYDYSDSDNIVIGLMAAAASGRTYDQLLRRLVYRRAGLEHTSLPKTVEMPRPYLRGYTIENGTPADDSELINPALAWASGGIVSTPRDVGRFFRAYAGARLFDRAVQRRQLDFVVGSSSPPGPGENFGGLAVFRYRTRCGSVLGHTGSFPGYRMFAAATRNGRRSIVFAVNSQIVPPDQGDQRISRLIRRAQERAVCKMLR